MESLHEGGDGLQIDAFGLGIEVGRSHFIAAFREGLLFREIADIAVGVSHEVRKRGRRSRFNLFPEVAEQFARERRPHQVADTNDGGRNRNGSGREILKQLAIIPRQKNVGGFQLNAGAKAGFR